MQTSNRHTLSTYDVLITCDRTYGFYLHCSRYPGIDVDPLVCPKCGGQMKIISFIERHQSELIPLRSLSYGTAGRKDSPALRIVGERIGSGSTRRSDSRLKPIQGSENKGARVEFRQNRAGSSGAGIVSSGLKTATRIFQPTGTQR